MKKILKYIKNPSNLIIHFAAKNIIKCSDKKYLELKYKSILGKKLDLKNPKTFNEKLQWLKLYDRKDIYTTMVDKFAVKEYVSNIIGKEYIIPTLATYKNFDDIDFDSLPKQFVLKCTHDSGGIVIVDDKEKLNMKSAKEKITKSLNRNFYYHGREWPYKNVKPQILVEKFMKDEHSNELIDYKVMCFNGVPQMIFTCTDRYTDGLKVTFFDLDWNKLPFERHYPSSKKNIAKPQNLDLMLDLSKKLSADIPFVRLDWYETNGKLYFGEYTFYPGDGYEEFTPEKWDYELGKLLELPIKKGDSNE